MIEESPQQRGLARPWWSAFTVAPPMDWLCPQCTSRDFYIVKEVLGKETRQLRGAPKGRRVVHYKLSWKGYGSRARGGSGSTSGAASSSDAVSSSNAPAEELKRPRREYRRVEARSSVVLFMWVLLHYFSTSELGFSRIFS